MSSGGIPKTSFRAVCPNNHFFFLKNNYQMANYAVSVLAKGQSIVKDKYQAPEQRRKVPTVMELALNNESISIPDANELRKSPLRTVEINYFTNVTQGSATTKAYNHTGNYGDNDKITLVYVTHVETFSLPRKLADNSIYSYQQLFNNLYEMKWKNLRTRHDNSALAFLLSNRCQLDNATIDPQIASANPGAWNAGTFALEISANDKSRFAQKAQMFMAARYLQGEYDVIADLQTAGEFQYQQQQGSGNSANTSWQFGPMNIAATQDQISSAYALGASIWLPRGLFAGMYYNEALNKRGVNSGENEIGVIGTQSDPFGSRAVADISMYTQRADTSANTTGGSTQDIVDQWELSLTIAYALPPLKTTGDSVAHLIGQAS
jgi:hypothetical protein